MLRLALEKNGILLDIVKIVYLYAKPRSTRWKYDKLWNKWVRYYAV